MDGFLFILAKTMRIEDWRIIPPIHRDCMLVCHCEPRFAAKQSMFLAAPWGVDCFGVPPRNDEEKRASIDNEVRNEEIRIKRLPLCGNFIKSYPVRHKV